MVRFISVFQYYSTTTLLYTTELYAASVVRNPCDNVETDFSR